MLGREAAPPRCEETGRGALVGWFSSSPASAASLGSEASTPARPKALGSFESLKQVRAGELDIGYAEVGPAKGPVVVLLHGWPYDIHSYVDVAPPLAAEGYRVIVPYLRGYGATTFRSSKTFRNGRRRKLNPRQPNSP